ncbi:uncharacterized protein TNCV_4864941 [Trichonephila clavipes]|nr:uncharacterized protein TNCV_4864941 [Trichonephila clavipes]
MFQTPNRSHATKLTETSGSFKGSWQPAPCKVKDDQNYLQTEGLNIHQCAKKIRALQTVLVGKRKEFVDDALIHAKSLCEELEISFELQDESGGCIYLATEVKMFRVIVRR